MEAIYPISALQKETAAVREEARRGVVRLTENGRGAFVFCSEEVFENRIAREVEDALFERRIIEELDTALAQFEAGKVIPAEESRAHIRAVRAARAREAQASHD